MMAADAATGMDFSDGNFVPVKWSDWLTFQSGLVTIASPAAAGSVTYRFRYTPSSRLADGPFLNAICQLHMRRCTSFRGELSLN